LTNMIPKRVRFPRPRVGFAAVGAIALLSLACQSKPDAAKETTGATPVNRASDVDLVERASPGTEIQVATRNGMEVRGIAVVIVKADGTRVPGVFRGPVKMCEKLSEGTWVFKAGQHSRARELEADDRITAVRRG
jgi:hypothetical protein